MLRTRTGPDEAAAYLDEVKYDRTQSALMNHDINGMPTPTTKSMSKHIQDFKQTNSKRY